MYSGEKYFLVLFNQDLELKAIAAKTQTVQFCKGLSPFELTLLLKLLPARKCCTLWLCSC